MVISNCRFTVYTKVNDRELGRNVDSIDPNFEGVQGYLDDISNAPMSKVANLALQSEISITHLIRVQQGSIHFQDFNELPIGSQLRVTHIRDAILKNFVPTPDNVPYVFKVAYIADGDVMGREKTIYLERS